MIFKTEYGQFKLKLVASINIAAILSLFNIASTTSSYWIKYIDNNSGNTHFAGMWRSCPNQGDCQWKNGIVHHTHSPWSIAVRFLISLGTFSNVILVGWLTSALIFKLKKKSLYTIRCLEAGNLTLTGSFICLVIGFCIFISSTCNVSLWLFVLSMIILIVTCNLLTRYFASVDYQCKKLSGKSVEIAISHPKLPCDNEEGTALTKEESPEVKTEIEMDKIETGSSEALINETKHAQVEIIITSDENKTDEKAQEAINAVTA
jgi:hypothetical protein